MEQTYNFVGTIEKRQRECDFSFAKVIVGDVYIEIAGDSFEYRSI